MREPRKNLLKKCRMFFVRMLTDDTHIDKNKLRLDEILSNIDTFEEYIVLKNINSNYQAIRIFCKDRLPFILYNAILRNKVFIDDTYKELKDNHRHILAHLLIIGKIKNDLNFKVAFRFYDRDEFRGGKCRDTDIRARLLAPKQSRQNPSPKLREWKVLKYNFIKKAKDNFEEDVYSPKEFIDEDSVYMHLFSLLWEVADKKKSDIITKFCQKLFLFHKGENYKYKIILLYVEAHEIARLNNMRKEFPPFGVLYLASAIMEAGWDVDVKPINKNDILEEVKIREFSKYDIVGLSITSAYAYDTFKHYFNSNKEFMLNHNCIIAGGLQAEISYKDVMKKLNVKTVFRGESEESIQEYLEAFESKGPWYKSYKKIKGIYYKTTKGKIIKTEDRENKPDIDLFSEPARDKLPDKSYFIMNRLPDKNIDMTHILFSRGCSMRCSYCVTPFGGKIRYRAPHQIVKELQKLKADYGIGGFAIVDDCFLTIKQKAIDIMKAIISADLELKWSLVARADQIDNEILDYLVKSGCIEIKIGIDSASDTILSAMKKGHSVQKAKETINLINEKKIDLKIFIISGLPGETDETNKETISFLNEMKDKIQRVALLKFAPLPGSFIYNNYKTFDINPELLNENYYGKMYVYNSNTNWWVDENRYNNYEGYHNNLKNCISNNPNWREHYDEENISIE
jgi:radical SAM superfamily enzyme YgiQ (UPF0313 family)